MRLISKLKVCTRQSCRLLVIVASAFICCGAGAAHVELPLFGEGVWRAVPTAAGDDQTLDELLLPESVWVGRILWDADSGGNDERDWFFHFHLTSRDGTHFRGRIDLGEDGHVPAQNVIVTGEFKDDEIALTSDKQVNFQMQLRGKLTDRKTIQLHWTGTDRKNQKRTGTATLKLKQTGPATAAN